MGIALLHGIDLVGHPAECIAAAQKGDQRFAAVQAGLRGGAGQCAEIQRAGELGQTAVCIDKLNLRRVQRDSTDRLGGGDGNSSSPGVLRGDGTDIKPHPGQKLLGMLCRVGDGVKACECSVTQTAAVNANCSKEPDPLPPARCRPTAPWRRSERRHCHRTH